MAYDGFPGQGVAVVSAGCVGFLQNGEAGGLCDGRRSMYPGVVREGTATLVDVNGVEVVAVLATPSIASVLVDVLMSTALRGSRHARRVACAIVVAWG